MSITCCFRVLTRSGPTSSARSTRPETSSRSHLGGMHSDPRTMRGGFDLRHEQRVRAQACDLEKIRAVQKRRCLREYALLHVTPEMRRRLAGGVEENVAVVAFRDLVAPSLERFAKDGREANAHEVERSEHLNGANVRSEEHTSEL